MNFLSEERLAQSYALGEITSVTLFAVGELFEVRLATTNGPSKLADGDDGVSQGFDDPREALSFLGKLGIREIAVDISGWHAIETESTHEDWMKSKINASMAGLKDGSNRVFSEEEWEVMRAAKQTGRGGV